MRAPQPRLKSRRRRGSEHDLPLRWKTTQSPIEFPAFRMPVITLSRIAASPIHSRQIKATCGRAADGKASAALNARCARWSICSSIRSRSSHAVTTSLYTAASSTTRRECGRSPATKSGSFSIGALGSPCARSILPHWRVVMRRERDDPRFGRLVFHDSYRRALGRRHPEAIEEMRAAVRAKGTVSNRDFEMHARRRVNNYRGRKDSAVALYYLWRTGELMTHHRERFERVYGLAEDIAPAHFLRESSDEEADAFLIRKTIAFHGLHRLSGGGSGDIGNPVLNRVLRRPVTAREVARLREKMLSDGDIVAVQVEGLKDLHYALASDAKDLREVSAGRAPRAWQPCDTTTREEVTFLSPLDIVTARERARALFDFDYKWEVYVPPAQRKVRLLCATDSGGTTLSSREAISNWIAPATHLSCAGSGLRIARLRWIWRSMMRSQKVSRGSCASSEPRNSIPAR